MQARHLDVISAVFRTILILVVMFVIITGLYSMGAIVGKSYMQKQAVERGYAQYRTDTGEWTWKCDLEKQP